MKIAVISDLHLGNGDVADRFLHDDQTFLRFLDHLEANFERIVLLGDVYDSLVAPRLNDAVRSMEACHAAHREISERFARPRYQYVHGNHDAVAAHTHRAPDALEIEADGVRLLFTHGHLHDWIIRKARRLSEVGAWLGGWLLRMRMRGMFQLFYHLDHLIETRTSVDPLQCSFKRWAYERARERRADVVITGHTHEASCVEFKDRLFMNSGACADGLFSFLSLDTRAGRYQVHHAW